MKENAWKKMMAACFALIAAAALCSRLLGWLDGAELKLEDALCQHPSGASEDIAVIGIDEETLARMGDFTTWSRQGMADLITLLTADPESAPAVIGIDVGFYSKKDADADAALVAAVKAADKAGVPVVFASALTFGHVIGEDAGGGPGLTTAPVLLESPFDELASMSLSGHANVSLDHDGVARRILANIEYNRRNVKAFSTVLYEAYTHKEFPADGSGPLRILYSARPYAYFGAAASGASLVKVLDGEYPAAFFKDKAVLVGAFASGLMDEYTTPVSADTHMYGVEIHANALQAMLEGKFLAEVPPVWEAALCLALLAALLLALMKLDVKFSLPICAAALAAYAGAAALLAENGLVLRLAEFSGAVLLFMIARFVIRFAQQRAEKRRMISYYSRFLPGSVARDIAQRGEEAMRLGGKRKHIAVLFVDIRGFTTMSEGMEPEELVGVLDRYLNLTAGCVFRQGGTVDKFIGDATMALFNAPQDLDDYIFRAVCAGMDMAERGKTLFQGEERQIGFGIGVNCGDAVVGNVGTGFRMDYTAIGDTVNTASRVEGQAKSGEVLITKEVYEAVKDRVVCADAGALKLKGKAEPVPVWRAERLQNGVLRDTYVSDEF